MTATQTTYVGFVKQVLTGDTVIIRGTPIGGPPKEKQISLSNIAAPKLGRRLPSGEEIKDEPYAWEAREFLRKKLVGEKVTFTIEKTNANTTREYGCVYLGKDTSGVNITELLVEEGLASVRREGARSTQDHARLIELEEAAKSAKKGKWATSGAQEHVRDIKRTIENPRTFVDKYQKKPIKAIIEHVRDGSTVRALLLPDFYSIMLMISGIRCPGCKTDNDGKPEAFAEEARYVVESMLLQRDVEIVLESVSNNNFVGSILYPKGNIAEVLLRQGFARCVDWSMAHMKSGAEKLRAAEKYAKEKRLRLWKDYLPVTGGDKESFHGVVCEVINGDALQVKLNDGTKRKIFLASIRPPRETKSTDEKTGDQTAPTPRPKGFKPLYDIPWMFEAREFLRKKLIGKKVHVVVDYVQEERDTLPKKVCCTVTIGGVNVAEALVGKGLATVVRYRQDDDQRSSHYDELMAAETKAAKSGNGLHSKKDIPTHRVTDISADVTKAKVYLPFFMKGKKTEAIVDFVASGSRLRLYIPKESWLLTFLLGGVNCPRNARPTGYNNTVQTVPFADEAKKFTEDKCLQREVEILIETQKGGNFIGWLWVEGVNLAVALVEASLASVHPSGEKSEYCKALKSAEDAAKARREKIWKDYTEENEEDKKIEEERVAERKVSYQKVEIVYVTDEMKIYVHFSDQKANIEQLQLKIQQEFAANPPLSGAYTPKKGEICAAKFSSDNKWYRAKVEKVTGPKVSVFYIDYGNREILNVTDCAALPSGLASEKAFAHEYGLAFTTLPSDEDDKKAAVRALREEEGVPLLLNVEYKNNAQFATFVDLDQKRDVGKELVKDGFLLLDKRKEYKLQSLMTEYAAAEDTARSSRCGIWEYGDIRADDAKEFGYGR